MNVHKKLCHVRIDEYYMLSLSYIFVFDKFNTVNVLIHTIIPKIKWSKPSHAGFTGCKSKKIFSSNKQVYPLDEAYMAFQFNSHADYLNVFMDPSQSLGYS